MDLFLGEEKSIFQNEDHGVEMGEMGEMYFYKPMKILILFLSIDTKRS
jgi:hypothetical protein